MKKVRKIELRLLIVLAVCMLFSIGGILLFHSLGIDLEDFVHSRYIGQEESLGIWHGWILIQTDSYRRVNQYFTQQPAGLERV